MTELLYLGDMQQLEGEARVVSARELDGRFDLVLDRTLFYPQGGGQPFDTGTIHAGEAEFGVAEVRFIEGVVHHYGTFVGGSLSSGDTVVMRVDAARRALHSRIHSAGHVVDMAVAALGLGWRPGKGYHFPDGPYVEYSGARMVTDRDALRADLEREANAVVAEGRATTIRFMPKEEMGAVCHSVPDELPAGKPQRVVLYGDFGVPCGGTHVANLAEIGGVVIRKLKFSGETVRVAYAVS